MELRSVAALIEASRKMPIWEAILCSDLEEDTPEQRAASLEKCKCSGMMQDLPPAMTVLSVPSAGFPAGTGRSILRCCPPAR